MSESKIDSVHLRFIVHNFALILTFYALLFRKYKNISEGDSSEEVENELNKLCLIEIEKRGLSFHNLLHKPSLMVKAQIRK